MPAQPAMPLPSWPWWVRLTHWLVAAAVLVNLFNDTGAWHRMLGYACGAMVLIRIGCGCRLRGRVAGFWWPTFADVQQHVRLSLMRMPDAHPGHNPLGQWAVYAMWTMIGLLVLTGWLSRTDALWGEDWPVDIHGLLADMLLAMVILHLVAVGFLSWLQKRNLVRAMVIGMRPDSSVDDRS